MATEEITISELELATEVLADMTIPVDTATETRAVTLKQLRAWLGSSLPTGFIIPAVGKISDERFTLLDGKTLSRVGTYEAFCNKVVSEVQAGNWFACSEDEYAQDLSDFGQCGKFVVSNDYVRIPTITRFIGATITLSEIGKTYKESLPNIKGVVGAFTAGTPSGAFYTEGSSSKGSAQDGTDSISKMDASRYSSTYQDEAKVQPDHTKYPYYMVISTEGQTAEVGIDINKVFEDLNLKANTSLSNVTANIDFVVESYNDGVNWYRVYKSGWIEQGGKVTEINNVTVNLLKPYKDTNYSVLNTYIDTENTGTIEVRNVAVWNRTPTSFVVRTSPTSGISKCWEAKGQGA